MKNKSEFDITKFYDYSSVKSQYSDEYIKARCSVVISDENQMIKIACAKSKAKDAFLMAKEIHCPAKIEFVTVEDTEFEEFIGNIVEKGLSERNEKLLSSKDENLRNDLSECQSLEQVSDTSAVVNIVNAVCLSAIRMKASDIHIVPQNGRTVIRFRIDGVLKNIKELDPTFMNTISSRIKVLANMNIMEQRLPQDGHIKVKSGNKEIDMRVSVIPVVGGESIVLRIFNNDSQKAVLEELGFSKDNYFLLKKSLKLVNGLVLISGPTGSGKTTTIHSLLNKLDKEALEIITIEDPVERVIEGVRQIQVNEDIGLTFDKILRRVLRQDPDVIMIGEIRDKVTAELAVRASQTGHLIFSTLHANDSVSCISRLKNLGIEPYLVANVLKLCMAQRLVRRLCGCSKDGGCAACNFTGYKGRAVISEGFMVDEVMARMITENKTDEEIKKHLKGTKIKFIRDDVRQKIKLGITDLREACREVELETV